MIDYNKYFAMEALRVAAARSKIDYKIKYSKELKADPGSCGRYIRTEWYEVYDQKDKRVYGSTSLDNVQKWIAKQSSN